MNGYNEYSGIDWNSDYAYPLQWLYESELARRAYMEKIHRVQIAMQGDACENLYEKELMSIIGRVEDAEQKKVLEKRLWGAFPDRSCGAVFCRQKEQKPICPAAGRGFRAA